MIKNLLILGCFIYSHVKCLRDTTPNPNRKWIDEPPKIQLDYGTVIGNAVQLTQFKQVHTFLGVPYAKAPMPKPWSRENYRFRPPVDPDYFGDYDARYFRPACPQNLEYLEKKLTFLNTSEDCLFMNIYTPFYTNDPIDNRQTFPVLVYIHGGDFIRGSGQEFAGDILAQDEMVIVTFNYRLGALGFMSTLDEESPGNYGLMDQVQALSFVKRQIHHFFGKPNDITVAGQGAGAMSIGLLIISPYLLSKEAEVGKGSFFKNAMAMSGSDFNEDAYVQPKNGSLEYALDLGRQLGCPWQQTTRRLVDCLRDHRTYEEIQGAGDNVKRKSGWYMYGWTGGPWAATVYDGPSGFIPHTPPVMRDFKTFKKVHYLSGITEYECADKLMSIPNVDYGVSTETFNRLTYDWVRSRGIQDYERVNESLVQEYTYWAQPKNSTRRRMQLIFLYSDQKYGAGVDKGLKSHAETGVNTYMYVFTHRSIYSPNPKWMGAVHGDDVKYFMAEPYLDDVLYNNTGFYNIPKYTELDKNVSDYMVTLFLNFAKYGNPTRNPVLNQTWYPYLKSSTITNLTYITIQNASYNYHDYRQGYYAYWNFYYPFISKQDFYTTTPMPTREMQDNVRYPLFVLLGVAPILLIIILAISVAFCRRKKVIQEGPTEVNVPMFR